MAYEDILFFVNRKINSGKVTFSLVDICVIDNKPYGNCKIVSKHLVYKYAPNMATF